MQATINYEFAVGLFVWATTLDANWRKKSLDDEDILEESFDGETTDERAAILAFKVKCYLNIARCYFKQREFGVARQACDWALRLDGTSDKALLLRATILVEPVSHGSTERDSAIVDLGVDLCFAGQRAHLSSSSSRRRRVDSSGLVTSFIANHSQE